MADRSPDRPRLEYRELPSEDKFRILLETRAARPAGERMWVFAFGSLMWNPCYEFDAKASGLLKGYDRKFHIWTTRARGTPECPGLGLCLEDCSGSCRGVVHRVTEADEEAAWERLWKREMGSGVYRPAWVTVETDDFGPVVALTFIVNRDHSHYAGPMPLDDMAAVMADAKGKYGLCRDYLAGTISEMKKLNVVDQDLVTLLAKIDKEKADQNERN